LTTKSLSANIQLLNILIFLYNFAQSASGKININKFFKKYQLDSLSKKLINQNFDKSDQFDLYLWGHWWACKDCWGKMLEIPIHNVYLMEGSEVFFNERDPKNIIGHQFDDYKKN
jgi:hypothetical protein